MNFGFDPAHFYLNRIAPPTWALTTRTVSDMLPDAVMKTVIDQLNDIEQTTEQVLQWAMTDPVATAKFQNRHTYATGVVGDYFIGRQHFDLDDDYPDKVLVETECCLTSTDYQGLPAIYQRYLVTLSWDPLTRNGQMVLAHDKDRDSHISALTLTLIDTASVSDIPERDGLDEEGHALLARRWTEFLTCIQQAAREIIDDGSACGALDHSFFPSRLEMTGNYVISRVSSSEAGQIDVDLRFTKLQRMTSRGEDDYLGFDLTVFFGDEDQLRYELWGSSSI